MTPPVQADLRPHAGSLDRPHSRLLASHVAYQGRNSDSLTTGRALRRLDQSPRRRS
jgi:hypothetical protein